MGIHAQAYRRGPLLPAAMVTSCQARSGNAFAKEVIQSWANAEWFTSRPEVPQKITVTVFKVPGETNTDDLSPAPDAWSRPDIPLHAVAMLKNTRAGAPFVPEEDGKRGPLKLIDELKAKGHQVAYVGDVVGTGSSLHTSGSAPFVLRIGGAKVLLGREALVTAAIVAPNAKAKVKTLSVVQGCICSGIIKTAKGATLECAGDEPGSPSGAFLD